MGTRMMAATDILKGEGAELLKAPVVRTINGLGNDFAKLDDPKAKEDLTEALKALLSPAEPVSNGDVTNALEILGIPDKTIAKWVEELDEIELQRKENERVKKENEDKANEIVKQNERLEAEKGELIKQAEEMKEEKKVLEAA